jgi:hypothetical protein
MEPSRSAINAASVRNLETTPRHETTGTSCDLGVRLSLWEHDYWKGGFRHHRVSAASWSPVLDTGASEFIQFDHDHQRTIAAVHAEWLAHALSTSPSDRGSAETADM